MTKEQIYDEQINPLVAQIIAICQEHKIAMLATFSTPNEQDPDLRCTTALLTDAYEPDEAMKEALQVLWHGRRTSPLQMTTLGADGEVTDVTVVLG